MAGALESGSPAAAPELLAYHYTKAGLASQAITNWQLAGQRATRRAGNTEAIQHFQKALELLASQPENNERNATELKVLTNMGPLMMMMMMKGGSSTADELWRLSNERQLLFTGAGAQVFGGWAMVKQGQTDAGLDQMREGLATWEHLGQRMFRQAIHCLYAEALVIAREYALAMDNLNQGLALGEQTGERWWESRVHQLHAQVALEEGEALLDELW